jgi:hypothetical protein
MLHRVVRVERTRFPSVGFLSEFSTSLGQKRTFVPTDGLSSLMLVNGALSGCRKVTVSTLGSALAARGRDVVEHDVAEDVALLPELT